MQALFILPAIIVLACASLVSAQQAGKVPRIGYVGHVKQTTIKSENSIAFAGKLRELGWVDGKNIIIEWRFAHGVEERVPKIIAELIGLNVDVIVATGARPVRIAQQATKTIPIVMTNPADPVANKFVASLARPGGNVTGTAALGLKLDGKRLEILKQAVPKLSSVVHLWQHGRRLAETELQTTELTAKTLGLTLQSFSVKGPEHFEQAFTQISPGLPVGVLVTLSQIMNSYRFHLAELLASKRIPAMYGDRRYADSGGLMSYGANIPALFARAATYVDRILKGANPAELPVELPTNLELVINLKAAEKIGLTIAGNVLRWADDVIK